jgi:hypothetical protein
VGGGGGDGLPVPPAGGHKRAREGEGGAMGILRDMIDLVGEEDELFGPDAPCPARIEAGANDRVLLVTGENGGGKSFLCRYLEANSRDAEDRRVEFMRVGMGRRTESGIPRAMMFGDEDRESTGGISASVVEQGLRTCASRKAAHILCLDEPDVGMSEDVRGALGRYLAKFARGMPVLTAGLVLVTHSREVVRPLLDLSPWCIRVGEDPRPTRAWADEPPPPMDEEGFLGLAGRNHARMLAIKTVLDARRRRQATAP